VTVPAKFENSGPLESSIPGAPLESIVCTEELRSRPSRRPNHEKENAALLALSSTLADSPHTILQTLADKVLDILDADSAGLSLLTKDGKRFYWAAIAGAWGPHLGGGTPRDFGPCGDVLDHDIPMLFSHWERRYPYLIAATPLADEGLLAPFYVKGKSVGTIWAIAHTDRHKFDREDLRLLESMGRFASAAYQVVESSEEALAKVRSELAHVTRVMSLGALTASIAHEINQPLSGIVTNANTCLRMLAADPPNVDGARETARRTIRDGNRAADVITRLRGLFARSDSPTGSVNLNEATEEVIALARNELHRSRVVLRTDLADDLPFVTGDRVQLQQVILNLLLNACDAMMGVEDRPRHLVVRSDRDEDDQVRLTVQDSGVGVDPENVDKLFDAFYTTKSGGMGIGLSVSRSIIDSHHGRLWAVPNPGPGASFLFSLPTRADSVVDADDRGASPVDVSDGSISRQGAQ